LAASFFTDKKGVGNSAGGGRVGDVRGIRHLLKRGGDNSSGDDDDNDEDDDDGEAGMFKK
jgi:hypothetical protein